MIILMIQNISLTLFIKSLFILIILMIQNISLTLFIYKGFV
jgi:hypothetical protein